MNFVNADIGEVARAIGAATGKTIVVDPRVKGQLTLVSENPVDEDRALKTLQSALRMQGFSLLQDHGVLKVVPEADAKLQGVPTYIGNNPTAKGDQIVTQVFQLRRESANNLLPVLRPLISPNNTIAAYSSNNTLVVTDYADNIRRLASIISGIEGATGANIDIVQLNFADAAVVGPQAQKLLDLGALGNPDLTQKVSVVPDTRTNSIVLRSSGASRLNEAEALVVKLDTPTGRRATSISLRCATAMQQTSLRPFVAYWANQDPQTALQTVRKATETAKIRPGSQTATVRFRRCLVILTGRRQQWVRRQLQVARSLAAAASPLLLTTLATIREAEKSSPTCQLTRLSSPLLSRCLGI